MSRTPTVLAALAASCRVLANSNHLQSAAKREVFEFHLQWVNLVHSHSATENLSKDALIEGLAIRMARFVLNHEPSPPSKDCGTSDR